MKHTNLFLIMTLLLSAAMFSSCSSKQKIKAIDTADMDLNVNPAHDFYTYANGGWMENNPLPPDRSRFGSFDKLRDVAEKQLQSLFDQIEEQEHEAGTVGQKIAVFYAMGMDSVTIEKQGAEPLMPYLEQIAACQTKEEIQNLLIEYHLQGNSMLFSFYGSADRQNSDWVIPQLFQGGLGMSDRDYYTNTDERTQEIRNEYVNHVEKMFQLTGVEPDQAKVKTGNVLQIETRLAEASLTRLERRDPHRTFNKMNLSALSELSPDFDWDLFFTTLGFPAQEEINVGMPEFFSEISTMMNEITVEQWKDYFSWNMINRAASYLSDDFVNQDFEFYGKVMSGREENRVRWKRVQNTTNSVLSEAIGQMYVAEYFPPEAKERMEELVQNLKIALGQRIDDLEWMGDETKSKAHDKLEAMNVKIGYPDQWRDYSDLEVKTDSYFQNVMRSRAFGAAYNRSKINKPVDRSEWFMPPQTVNAYYSPLMNEIVFPAGILQPPFFYLDADDAVNYGAIGMVIGHEITHGFDDQGRKYDKDGNLNDWWTEEDAARFDERAQILVDQYNQFVVLDTVMANGELTLGENIADLGGLNIAYQAFQNAGKKAGNIGGFTPEQRFFLAYAHVWANHTREREMLRLTQEGVHSLGHFRVNGPLRNMPEFHHAFGVRDGDFMYLSDDERAMIW